MNAKQRKAIAERLQRRKDREAASKAEAQNGRIDFPNSKYYPKSKDNNIAEYKVYWTDSRGIMTGNGYKDIKKARQVRDLHRKQGNFLGTRTVYFAGYLF